MKSCEWQMFLKVIAITIIGYEIVYVVVKWTFAIRVSPKPLILLVTASKIG